MRLHPKITHRDQSLAVQPVIGHPRLGGQRSGLAPVAFGTQRRQDRLAAAPGETSKSTRSLVRDAASAARQ
jgi:hypothetical protein